MVLAIQLVKVFVVMAEELILSNVMIIILEVAMDAVQIVLFKQDGHAQVEHQFLQVYALILFQLAQFCKSKDQLTQLAKLFKV